MKKKFPLLLFISGLLISCGSSHQDRPDTSRRSAENVRLPLPGPGLPPSVCRVVATVLAVEPVSESGSPEDPCSNAPCNATVLIDSVLGYGSSFPGVLSPGDTVRTHFTFTLAPTSTMAASPKPPLPGLAVGSRFRAELEGVSGIGVSTSYAVAGYEVR